MKYILIIAALLISNMGARAQGAATFNAGFLAIHTAGDYGYFPATDNQKPGTCRATKIGKVVSLVGVGCIVVGGVALTSGWAKKNDDGYGTSYKEATAVALGGLTLLATGLVTYMIGNDNDKRRLKNFHIKGDNKKVSLVYNF